VLLHQLQLGHLLVVLLAARLSLSVLSLSLSLSLFHSLSPSLSLSALLGGGERVYGGGGGDGKDDNERGGDVGGCQGLEAEVEVGSDGGRGWRRDGRRAVTGANLNFPAKIKIGSPEVATLRDRALAARRSSQTKQRPRVPTRRLPSLSPPPLAPAQRCLASGFGWMPGRFIVV
jgi:hypothetical protein